MKEKLKEIRDNIFRYFGILSALFFSLAIGYCILILLGISIGVIMESYLWFRMFYGVN